MHKISIKNFKAIRSATLELSRFNVLVGTNGSGKSSALQAIHWVIQSGRNGEVTPNSSNTGSTLSERHATYMPSPDYRNASYRGRYGNFHNAGKLEVTFTKKFRFTDDSIRDVNAKLWIKAARNEGISVHIPSANAITRQIRATREYSCYIPGLAGIPLSEEKRSLSIVKRQAAAGDANTVLRNLLLLLHLDRKEVKFGRTKLKEVEHWASQVLGGITLYVYYNEKKDYSIKVDFLTDDMASKGLPQKPLELAGVGFLQVLQIFAYFVFFEPRLLLADEPDSHLHPDRQEKLINVMKDAAEAYDTQVILTTHSPNVIRALPYNANLLWMNRGEIGSNTEEIRSQMGWGLLDKKVLVLTEDKKTSILRKILSQWPDLENKVAVWPLHGIKKLPSADSLSEMGKIFGGSLKLLLHRDADFLLDTERIRWSKPYTDKGISTWITKGSDIEAYFTTLEYIQSSMNIDKAQAISIRKRAKNEILDWKKKFSDKRKIINKDEWLYPGGAGTPSTDQSLSEITASLLYSRKKFVGKALCAKIRKIAQEDGIAEASTFGKWIPKDVTLAPELKKLLQELI